MPYEHNGSLDFVARVLELSSTLFNFSHYCLIKPYIK